MSVLYIKSLGTELQECQKENMLLRKIIKEQGKIIELMAEYIDFDKIDLNCTSLCVKDNCREQCIIDYFKKKARDENG